MIKIHIDGIDRDKVPFGEKITLVDGKKKYSFFNSKKDGTRTKAFEQFKNADWGVGDTIEAEVAEEEKSFTGKDGNEVKYTERRIMFFSDGEQGVSTPNLPSKRPAEALSLSKPIVERPTSPSLINANKTNSEIDTILKQLSSEVNGLRKRIEDLENINGSGNPF